VLVAGGCGDATPESPVATSGTAGGEGAGAGQKLSVVDVRSGTETPFTAPVGASEFDITLDGSMVAYSALDPNGHAQVFVMDADGSNARQLTHDEGGGDYRGPSWSPDGSMIAYERDTSDNSQIFIVRLSNGDSTKATKEPRGAVDPGGWAPDGGSIVFSTFNPSIDQYSALSLDLTTGQTRLIVPDGSTPTLSPDGAWIAFNSYHHPEVRLILANSDGSGRRLIARLAGDDGYQEWSPDSSQIAFIGNAGADGFGTYVYDLATGGTRFVTNGTVESWVDDDHILVS
jgi:TolB protein